MNLQNTARNYATAKLTLVLVSIKPFNKGIEKALIANYLEMATQYLIGNKVPSTRRYGSEGKVEILYHYVL